VVHGYVEPIDNRLLNNSYYADRTPSHKVLITSRNPRPVDEWLVSIPCLAFGWHKSCVPWTTLSEAPASSCPSSSLRISFQALRFTTEQENQSQFWNDQVVPRMGLGLTLLGIWSWAGQWTFSLKLYFAFIVFHINYIPKFCTNGGACRKQFCRFLFEEFLGSSDIPP
jgi:hypothetical protein